MMVETVVLMGSEDVQRAGHQIQQAAASMQQSANQIEFALNQFIERFEFAVAQLESVYPKEAENEDD